MILLNVFFSLALKPLNTPSQHQHSFALLEEFQISARIKASSQSYRIAHLYKVQYLSYTDQTLPPNMAMRTMDRPIIPGVQWDQQPSIQCLMREDIPPGGRTTYRQYHIFAHAMLLQLIIS